MPNWCIFPKEVLNIIFLYVKANDKAYNNNNLSQCSLTCRDWRAPAQNVIFSEVYVKTTNNIDSLSRIVLENDGITKWVKVLKYSEACRCNTITLFATDLLFPNLEALDFLDNNNLLYSSFCKMLIENGNFKNLTNLPIPANREQDLMYSQCWDFLQERIASITLFDDDANNRDIHQDVIKKLDRFPKLKKVLINTTITTDMRYQNLVTYINPIIENNNLTPSLKELCITSSANSSYCFRLSTQREEGLLPMTKLKSLNVYMYNEKCVTVSEELILFIMYHCPNLNSLYMENIRNENNASCLYTLSYQQNLLQFMIYLLKMPNFSMQNSVLITKEATQLIEDCYTAIEKEPTLLKLSRALFITAYSESTGDSFGVIDFKNDCSMRSQSVDFRILRARSTPAHKIDEEQIQLVEKIGRFFNTVSLQITSPGYLETLLKCVAEIQCERLNTLIIEGLSGSVYNESFLQEKEIAHSNSIKELVLSNFCLSQEQLLHVSIILPRLGKLALKIFFKHKSQLSGKSFFSFCLPSWSLECLEIVMDLHFTGSRKEEKYYIKLAADEEHSSRYCFFTVKFANNKVTGYSLADSPTQAAFQESILNQEISTYYISCELVKEFTFKYIDAENGYHKTLCLFGKQSVV